MLFLRRKPWWAVAAAALSVAVCVAMPSAGVAREVVPVELISASPLGERVSVEGKVRSFRPSSRPNVPNSFLLQDNSGSVRVAVWPSVFDQVAGRDRLGDGAAARVRGKVAEFRGVRELHVEQPEDLVITDPGAAPGVPPPPSSPGAQTSPTPEGEVIEGITSTATLGKGDVGKTVTVSGRVVSARRPANERAPYILKVQDESGSVDVVFWENLASQLTPERKAEIGEMVQVRGEVGEFRGAVQLRLASAEDLKTPRSHPELFAAGATPKGANNTTSPGAGVPAPPPLATADDVSTVPLGSRVRIRGQVHRIDPLRLGRKILLQDETTSHAALILLWDTAEGLKPEARNLKTSSTLAVEGQVAQVEGVRVVVVRQADELLEVVP